MLAAWDHPSCKTFRIDPIRLSKLVFGAHGNHYGLQLHDATLGPPVRVLGDSDAKASKLAEAVCNSF